MNKGNAQRKLIALLGAALMCASNVVFGSLIPGYPDDFRRAYDPREVSLLPPYCKYTQLYRQNIPGGDNPTAIKHMYATYGPGFHALHHYCWAIIATNRALYLARSKELRAFYLKDAIGDIDYVIANSPRDFVLLPELLTAKAKNLIRLDRGAVAVGELLRAIEIKPDYWPPYAVLADYYQEMGEAKQARDILERGLSTIPDAQALKKRLVRLEHRPGEKRGSAARQ